MAETLISLTALAVGENEAKELADAVASDGTVLPVGEKEANDRELADAVSANGTDLHVGVKEANGKGFADVVAADGEEANPDRDTAYASEDRAAIVKRLSEDFIRELMQATLLPAVDHLEQNIRIMMDDASTMKLILLESNKKLTCFKEDLEDKLKSMNSKFDDLEDKLKIMTENLTSKIENSVNQGKNSKP